MISTRKQAKKMRKEARRQVDTVLGKGFAAVGSTLREKPDWLPRFIFLIPFYFVFNAKAMTYVKKYYR